MRKSLIYKITNPNGRIYIGQAIDWVHRLSKYRRLNCKSQPIVFNSLVKYGFDTHIFEVLEECDKTLLNSREMYYINKYKSNNHRYPEINGMNCNDGGGTSYGFKHTEEAKAKIRAANLGKRTAVNPVSIENLRPHKSQVIDSKTNIIYLSVSEAAKELNINRTTLTAWLKGRNGNTRYQYLKT